MKKYKVDDIVSLKKVIHAGKIYGRSKEWEQT